jgi:hypothetical protein
MNGLKKILRVVGLLSALMKMAMTEYGVSAASQVLHLVFEKIWRSRLVNRIYARSFFEDECATMKSNKKNDEDGLQYSAEKLSEDLVQILSQIYWTEIQRRNKNNKSFMNTPWHW